MKKGSPTYYCLIVISCLTLSITAGCNRETAILSTDQMTDLLFDIYRLDATLSQVDYFVDNPSRVKYYNSIFAKHHTNKAQFDHSLEWYAAHPDKWRLVYSKVGKKSKTFLEQVQSGELPELKAHGIAMSRYDTIDYWMSKEHLYWYDDIEHKLDTTRIRQTLDGRRYFIGARKVELTFRMRCHSDNHDTVRTEMIVEYIRGKKTDTLHVQAPADNKWRRYHISTGTPEKTISCIYLSVADTASFARLSSLEYEDLHLNYIYLKQGEHINTADQREFNYSKSMKQNGQEYFNAKRNDNGETNSSQLDTLPVLKAPRRHD